MKVSSVIYVFDSVVKNIILYLLFIFISTELLSRFNLINRTSIIILNSIFLIVNLFFVYKNKKIFKDFFKKIFTNYSFWILLLLISIIIYTALYYPPNTWDSMTYHMSRVMHWVQNGNVNFYKTQIERQLYSNPLAEYVILHWYLLFDSDIFSNFVQVFSFVICGILSFLITKEVYKKNFLNILPFILTWTIPMAILQSTGTQNDLFVSMLLMIIIYFGFKNNWLYFGFGLGLGLLAKNTFAIFALPFCFYFAFKWYREFGFKKTINWSIFFIVAIFLTNIFHWSRNYSYFKSYTGSNVIQYEILNRNSDYKILLSNIIKNLSSHLSFPVDNYNNYLFKLVEVFHKTIDFKLNNYRNNFYGMEYNIDYFYIHEDYSGNFVLTILIVISFPFFIKNKKYRFYMFSLLFGILTFYYLFKWNPWINRLILPFFIAYVPLISVFIDNILKNNFIKYITILLLIIFSLPFYFGNFIGLKNIDYYVSSSRQILPMPDFGRNNRFERYFYNRKEIYNSFIDTSSLIDNNNINNLVLFVGADSYEYPWWVYSKKINDKNIKIINGNSLDIDKIPAGKSLIIFDDDRIDNYSYKINYLDKFIFVKKNDFYSAYMLNN